MSANNVFDVMAAIVTVALVTVIVTKPNTAAVIRAMGDAFSGSIRVAMGN